MSPNVNELGDHRQVSAALANKHAPQHEQYTRCPRCNRFGIVSDTHDYYGTIYHCVCKDVFWVISPETGNKLEGG